MRPINFMLAVVAATLLATGCSQQKQNATKVLESVEMKLAEVKNEAERYAPDGLKSLEAKEYNDVIAAAPQLNKAVDSLKEAVESGKAHASAALASAKAEWESL